MSFFSQKQRMGAAALILAASTILSRLMGLVRDKVISWQFGAGSEADMYFAAFVVPDIINHLLAGGIMAITIIPLLSRRFQEDEDDGWRFFSCIFCWMVVASLLVTGAGMLGAEELARITAPGFDAAQTARLAFFMRIILPAQVFFLCGACVTALLYMRRQFRVPALAPLIYNGCIIAGGLLLPWLTQGMDLPAEWELGGMTGYCVGVTVGACLGAFLLPFRVAAAGGLRLSPVFRHPLLKRFLIMALPLMLGQTVIFLDEQFMRVFGSLVGDGAVSLLNYARRIMQVPVGLMGQAAAVASYPFLVSLLTNGEKERFDQTLSAALRASVGLIIPCALWMGVAAQPIMGVIFQGGRFGLAETVASTPLLQIMLAATPLWILYMVLVRAFYADGDTLTPATTGTVMTLLALPAYYSVGRASGRVGHRPDLGGERQRLCALAGGHLGTTSGHERLCGPAFPVRPGPVVFPARRCGLLGGPVRAGRPACLRDAGAARRGSGLPDLRCQRSGLCRDLPALELQAGTRHIWNLSGGGCGAAVRRDRPREDGGTAVVHAWLGTAVCRRQKAVPRTRRYAPCPEPGGRRKAFPSSSRRRRCKKYC